jgi:O-antigen/teichoic acid export membrane protein
MSRFRSLARNVSSGYLQLGANILHTLVSVPLALRYLSKEEFALWALVSQIAGYLLLVDAGITGASMRFLIDHKDHPQDGKYGSVFKTGSVVHTIQGLMIALLSCAMGAVPQLFDVPSQHERAFQVLLLGHGIMLGLSFTVRMFGSALNAHQRHDVVNYTTTIAFGMNLGVLWFGFHQGWGVYSLLAAYAASTLMPASVHVLTSWWLKLLPPPNARGSYDRAIFKQLFWFANDLLLLAIGVQLVNASQVIVITRSLGLEAAAVWLVAMKGFGVAQQFVWRLWDYASTAVSEMIVREERDRLYHRFKTFWICTASMSAVIGIAVAVCNESFLAVWTNRRIAWNGLNDFLLPLVLVVTSVTRVQAGLIVTTKNIRGLRYMYFAEGVTFVALGFLFAPLFGFSAVLISAVITNIGFTGVYSTRRTAEEFGVARRTVMSWLAPACRVTAVLAPLGMAAWWLTLALPDKWRLAANAIIMATAGAMLLWRFGIPGELRVELSGKIRAALARRAPRPS